MFKYINLWFFLDFENILWKLASHICQLATIYFNLLGSGCALNYYTHFKITLLKDMKVWMLYIWQGKVLKERHAGLYLNCHKNQYLLAYSHLFKNVGLHILNRIKNTCWPTLIMLILSLGSIHFGLKKYFFRLHGWKEVLYEHYS